MITLKGKHNSDCKIFIDTVEPGVVELVKGILDNPISEGVQVRIMPDTHVGEGIVIGFTMPVTTMVGPNYIGVDIGCSVTSHKLSKRLDINEFPVINLIIREAVPLGTEIHPAGRGMIGWDASFFEQATVSIAAFQKEWKKRTDQSKPAIVVDSSYISTMCRRIGISEAVFYGSIGTLGGGNHFIEIGESAADGSHWLTIHSGSRNFGLKVCKYHVRKMAGAKGLPQAYHDQLAHITQNTLPKSDIPGKLAELKSRYRIGERLTMLSGDDMYDYLVDMVVAQSYARFNHIRMSELIFSALGDGIHAVETIHSMHNFIDPSDWIIRKGAIRAYKGEKILIPFNMRDGILICEGKSNADWNFSAPHGAGRILARNQARKMLSMDQFTKEMTGVYSTSICEATLDESPMAYKDKETIMQAITDTATVLDTIRPLFNIKAK